MPDKIVGIESRAPEVGQDSAATQSELAYGLIRRDILDGQLEAGSRLKILMMRARYGLGPTPLREAMSRLSSEGLIVLEQQRGFRVAPVTLADLDELSSLRVLLEVEALRLAILHGDDDWEGAIVSAFHKLARLELQAARGETPSAALWEERNGEFHDALVGAAGSQWLMRTRAHLYDLHGRYRRISRMHYSDSNRAVHEEHEALMKAVLERDAKRAAALIRVHIENTAKAIRSSGALAPTAGSARNTVRKIR